jgi:chromate reductase
LLLANPEYNALPTPLFINAFDWLSTVSATEALPGGTGATAGKPVGLLAASPGALGGIRALPIVRTYLSTNFAMVVVPEQLGLPGADHAFDEQGELLKPELNAVLDKLVASVVKQARWRLSGVA